MAKKKPAKAAGRTTASRKKSAGRKKAAKRELIDTGTDKRYVRRDDRGRFDEVDDVGRSLAQDRRRHAKTVSKPGQGDKGDRPRAKASSKRTATKGSTANRSTAKRSTAKRSKKA
jgi:hypothetical protein